MKRLNQIEGKLPPQAVDLEEAILGAIMMEKSSIESVIDLLIPTCFYKDSHALIFKAILSLESAKQPIDILTVTEELKKAGKLDEVGGAYYITQLTDKVTSTANLVYHSQVLVEKYLAREVIRLTGEFQSRGFSDEEDIFELIEELYKQIDIIKNYGIVDDNAPFNIQVDERVKEKEIMVRDGVKFTGIGTGNDILDKIIGGFVKQNLIVIAARPGMGKSVKGLNYAKECAMQGKTAIVFSLEMSSQELIDRYIVEQSGIPLQLYRANNLTHYQMDDLRAGAKALRKLPIVISDTPSINCNHIRRKIKSVQKTSEVGLIVVDYIQLMTAVDNKGNREQEISSISRGLKAIAKEFNLPVIALAQVSRAAESTKEKRPGLEHLRESGAIENDADIVMFIYRPAYYFAYGSFPVEKESNGNIIYCMYSKENIGQIDYERRSELLVAKNRNGEPGGMVKEHFIGHLSKFVELDKLTTEDPFVVEAIKPMDNSDIFNPAPF